MPKRQATGSRHFDGEDVLYHSIKEKYPQVKSIIVNVNAEDTNVILGKHSHTVYGEGFITDTLCGLRFEIAPEAFYQINRTQAETLYAKAKEYAHLSGSETLIDLYCGAGTIGLSMADKCKELIGVETPNATRRKTAYIMHAFSAVTRLPPRQNCAWRVLHPM